MSFNFGINYAQVNNSLNNTMGFKTGNTTFKTLKNLKVCKTPMGKNAKNIRNIFSSYRNKDFFNINKIKLNKQKYIYNHENIKNIFKSKNKEREKERRCKTSEVSRHIFVNLNLNNFHKNYLRSKLIKSKLYKLIVSKDIDNYLRNKREIDKKTFITMIDKKDKEQAQDSIGDNKNILSFEKSRTIIKEGEKEKTDKINIKYKTNLKKNKILESRNDLSIPNRFQKNSMKLSVTNNDKSNYKYKNDSKIIFSEPKNKIHNYLETDINTYNELELDSLNKINDYNFKKIDLYNIKPLTSPFIKFNSALDDYFKNILDIRPNEKSIANISNAKLRFEIINKVQLETYRAITEKNTFPVITAEATYNYYLRGQRYLFEYDNLYKQYLSFLALEYKKNQDELDDLLKQREKIFNQNSELKKKISDLKILLNKYEGLKKLCLMVKYKTKNISDIPAEEMQKYKININNRQVHRFITMANKSKNNIASQIDRSDIRKRSIVRKDCLKYNPFKKKKSTNYDKTNSIKGKNRSSRIITKIPSQIPVFEDIDEFLRKYIEQEQNIYKKYKIFNNSYYENTKLNFDFFKENQNLENPDYIYNCNIISRMKNELEFLKQKNKRLNNYKIYLLDIKIKNIENPSTNNSENQISLFETNNTNKDENNLKEKNKSKSKLKIKNRNQKYKNINNDNKNNKYINKINIISRSKDLSYGDNNNDENSFEENENTIALYKIYEKVKGILLNPKINIENILEMKNLYKIIKEKKSIKDIHFNGEFYSKEVFCIKILEMLYLKLIIWVKNCSKNEDLKQIFIKYESERENALRINNYKQKILKEKEYIIKRNKKIIDKANKPVILQNRKFNPFQKRYIYDKIIKKNIKEKKEKNKISNESVDEKYYNYLEY